MSNQRTFEKFFKKGFKAHSSGNFKQATEHYLRALGARPSSGITHRNLSLIKTYHSEDDEQLQAAIAILDDEALPATDRCHMLYAVGKALDDLQDYHQAFSCFESAGALKKHLDNYEYSSDQAIFYSLAATASNELQNIDPLAPDSGIRPIFIVGMPRSGTSLVEQILSMHSEVSALGELEYANEYGFRLAIGVEPINRKSLKTFRRKYLDSVAQHGHLKSVFTDKMPLNFRYLKLLSLALPEAKFIHISRDPRAVCWSNFRHFFNSDGMRFSSDLSDITNYYRDYLSLWSVWDADQDIATVNLRYENLIQDPKTAVSGMLRGVDLEFEQECLTPENSQRSINTASQLQVMQPIYAGSSEQWANYAANLETYFTNL